MAIILSRKKKFLGCFIILALILCCVLTSIIGYGVYAFNSNTNIPQVSDLIEKIEKRVVSEEQFDEMFTDELIKLINSYGTELETTDSYNGFNSDFAFNIKSIIEGMDMGLSGDGSISANEDSTNVSMESDLNLELAGMNLNSIVEFRVFAAEDTTETYLKFEKIPDFLTMVIPQLGELSDKWIYSKGDTTDTNTPIEPKTKENLIALVKSNEFKQLITRKPDRVINDIRNMCISFEANNDQFRALSNKYKEISGEKIFEEDVEINAETCFGRRSGIPSLIDLTYKAETLEVEFTIDNFDYPKSPITIERPTDYIDGKDLDLNTLSI